MILCAHQIVRISRIFSQQSRFFFLLVCNALGISPLLRVLLQVALIFFSNLTLSSYANFVLKFSSINLIISSLLIICRLALLPLLIFLSFTLLPAFLKTTVTSKPLIPIFLWYSTPGISIYSLIPNEKLFSLTCFFFKVLSIVTNNF